VCANALTVKIDTVERRLLEAIRSKILSPEPVRYLVAIVNRHLEAFRTTEGQARRGLEQELQQVDEELRNVERAILAGVVSEMTAALVQDREVRRRSLKARLVALEAQNTKQPIRADADTIARRLAKLDDLLHRDVARANAFFRTHVAPIVCRPVKEAGQKFYRATVAANEGEIIKSLGLAQAFDFGGCGGPQLPLVERRLRLGLLRMKSRGAVEHPLRHVPQAVLAHAEPHDARGQPDGADHVLLLDGDAPELLA